MLVVYKDSAFGGILRFVLWFLIILMQPKNKISVACCFLTCYADLCGERGKFDLTLPNRILVVTPTVPVFYSYQFCQIRSYITF